MALGLGILFLSCYGCGYMCQYHGKVFAVFHSVLLFLTYFIIFNINKLPFKRSYTRRSCFSTFVLNSIKQTVGVVDFFKGRKMITKKKKKKSPGSFVSKGNKQQRSRKGCSWSRPVSNFLFMRRGEREFPTPIYILCLSHCTS